MRTTTVVIGAGQAGLAVSHHLTRRSIDHVVLERGDVANSWRTERWDSLRLLTPNWLSRLPGWEYRGPEPDGYMTAAEVATHLDGYRRSFDPPVRTGTPVRSLTPASGGYRIRTDDEQWWATSVVIATGAASVPRIPRLAAELPPAITQLTSLRYRRPQQVGAGTVLVVGGSASGVQIADELRRDGRDVVLAVGDHVRVPRTYRGMDIHWWMDVVGVLDEGPADVPDLERARRVPSLQLVGSDDRRSLDLGTLSRDGVEITGRFVGLDGRHGLFAGSLRNFVASADLKMQRLLDRIDGYAREHGLDDEVEPPDRPGPTDIPRPRTRRDLRDVRTVVWATGFRPDHRWVDAELLDGRGAVRHDGGIGASPGLYVVGLPFMRRRSSAFIDGVGRDAAAVTEHLARYVGAGARTP